jgi:hypothetical protein
MKYKANELNSDSQNNEFIYSPNLPNEYIFAIGKGKERKNVIVKLNINSEDDVSYETIGKGLVKYINAFEKIIISQYGNKNAII